MGESAKPPDGPSTPTKTLPQNFASLVKGSSLDLHINAVQAMLSEDLGIRCDLMTNRIKLTMSYLLLHYIRTWPGWRMLRQCSKLGNVTIEDWYTKFKGYLTVKLKMMLQKTEEILKEEESIIDDDVLFKLHSDTQTDDIPDDNKANSPFILEIVGPPRLTNTLIFCEGLQDNITMKEYKSKIGWEEMLTSKQLLNWPYVMVEFSTEELHFIRSSSIEFNRYLTFSNEKIAFALHNEKVEEVAIVDKNKERKAFTLEAIKEYCKVYRAVLKKYKSNLCWRDRYMHQIEAILQNFLLDIEDLGLNSMATNTRVLFNFGNAAYARNKSIRTSENAICLTDSIVPKIALSLLKFTPFEDKNSTDETPFPKLQKLLEDDKLFSNLSSFIPRVSYTCTYCKETFSSNIEIWRHIRQKHIMEQPVLCYQCKQQWKVPILSENRWRHECTKTPTVGISNLKHENDLIEIQ